MIYRYNLVCILSWDLYLISTTAMCQILDYYWCNLLVFLQCHSSFLSEGHYWALLLGPYYSSFISYFLLLFSFPFKFQNWKPILCLSCFLSHSHLQLQGLQFLDFSYKSFKIVSFYLHRCVLCNSFFTLLKSFMLFIFHRFMFFYCLSVLLSRG